MKVALFATKSVIAAVGGVIAYYMGGWDTLLSVFFFMVICDYITGVLTAFYNKSVSSEIGFKGIIKKVIEIVIVAMAVMANRLMPEIALREMVITFFIANEGFSIIENCSKIIDLPPTLTKFFEQIGGKGDE